MKDITQALLFIAKGSMYALDSDDIVQILRVPEITPVPFMDESVLGVCSIEGHIFPILDFENIIFHNKIVHTELTDKARILTIKSNGHSFALLVREVLSNINVETGDIKSQDRGSGDSEAIVGILRYKDEIVQMVSVLRLLGFIKSIDFLKNEINDATKNSPMALTERVGYEKYLFFTLGDERFGINSELVREIITAPEQLTAIAGATAEVMGFLTLRDRVLVSVDFSVVFEKKGVRDEHNRVIIVKGSNGVAGLLVDAIMDIRDIPNDALEPLPQTFNKGKFKGVILLDKKPTSIIEDSVIEDVIKGAMVFCSNEQDVEQRKHESVESSDEEKLESVMFMVGENEYALGMDDIEEIIRYSDITPLVGSGEYLMGMLNLRGRIVPVLTLHKRLGAKESVNEHSKILVCGYENHSVGLLVDCISEVRDVPLTMLKEADGADEIISHAILLDSDKRIVQRLCIDRFFEDKSHFDFKGIL